MWIHGTHLPVTAGALHVLTHLLEFAAWGILAVVGIVLGRRVLAARRGDPVRGD